MTKRVSPRQLAAVAIYVTILAAPVAAAAAAAAFTSSGATPTVSATNTATMSGAKAVYGDASGTSGITYGVYGHAASTHGYGVYSAGRLGTSGTLVCSHCVTGADVNVATLPTVPDASNLAGHGASYYARIVPLSWTGSPDAGAFHGLADVGGVRVYATCTAGDLPVEARLSLAADTDADAGTVNALVVTSQGYANASGAPLSTVPRLVARSIGTNQAEGTATYRRDSDGRVVTVSYHVFAPTCEVFGNVLTAG